jgi:cyclic pyranopterin phosphate synthase
VDGNRARSEEITNEEIFHLIEAVASLGISKVRFTGGEPLLRDGVVDLVRRASELDGISLVGLTTNGLLLGSFLPSLVAAGLNRLNVSLDSLDRGTFRTITGVDGLDPVYASIIKAEETGAFGRVKVNTVVMRGVNESEIPRFARWALERRVDLRFIEFMPTQASNWGRERFISEAEIRDRIDLDLQEEHLYRNDSGPARSFHCRGYPGRVSFVSAVSRSFCNRCNRLRLTSRGDLLGCLFQDNSVNLRQLLSDGRTTDQIASDIRSVVSSSDFRRRPGDTSIGELRPSMRALGG